MVLDMTPEGVAPAEAKRQKASEKTLKRKPPRGLFKGHGDHQGSQAWFMVQLLYR